MCLFCSCGLLILVFGLPLFFLNCNYSVTNFCPEYNLFKGTVYMIKIDGTEYTKDNPPMFYSRRLTSLRYENETYHNCNDDKQKKYERYEDASVIYYAKYNDSIICRVTSSEILPSSMDLGKNVTWYSYKSDHTTCERETPIVKQWYAGLVLILISALLLVIDFCILIISFSLKPPRVADLFEFSP